MATKISAPASCGLIREMALLMAEASPELCDGTDVMRAVVSGATSIANPAPKTRLPGRKSTTYEPGGIKLEGWLGLRSHGWLDAGMRANHSAPTAINAGPAAMNHRAPKRPARAPKRVEKSTRRSVPGIPARPAAAAVYWRVPCWKRPRL